MSAKNGNPCIKCGANEWNKKGDCVPCAKARRRRYYAENPERAKERSRQWREANPERKKANRKEEYARNSEKAKADARQWRIDNPERKRETNRKWWQANRERAQERNRQWIRNNPDKKRAMLLRWRRANPGTCAAESSRRRTNQTAAGGEFTIAEWRALVDHYGGKCLCCGRTDVGLTADHVIPVSKGGTSNIDNIQPLCRSCNSRKHDKTIDYRPQSGLGRWIQRKLFG